MDEVRAVKPPWYPTFPYTRSRGFSLENLQRDVGELWADRSQLADEARQERALQAIQGGQSDMDRRTAPFRQSSAQSDPGRAIASLVSDVEATDKPEWRPSDRLPGDPFYHAKSPERSLEDAKRDKFLTGMLDRFGYPTDLHQYPKAWEAIDKAHPGAAQLKDAMMRYATDADRYRSDNQSPMEYHGVVGYGAPLHTLAAWGQSIPGMYYAAGEMGAKAVDPKGAPEKDPAGRFMHALNTFSAPGQAIAALAGYAPDTPSAHSAWSAQDAMRKEFDKAIGWQDLDPEGMRGVRDASIGMADRQMLGREYFANRGASPTVAAIAGGLTDDLLNPLLDIPGIGLAARSKGAARFLRTAEQLGQEVAPGLVLNGLHSLSGLSRQP